MLIAGIMTQMSGSLGGITASHNRGGLYLRSRAIPVNPATPFQESIRNATGYLTDRWLTGLTAVQRTSWEVYAANVPLTNKLGNVGEISGNSMYMRSNVPRLQAGLPLVDDAPTIFNLGGFSAPTFVGDTANDEVDVSFNNADDWANEDDSAMLVYISRPQNTTIKFFKGPYRLAGMIDGDGTTPPTSPAAITAPFPFVADNRIFLQIRVSRADGRLSDLFRGQFLAP